MCLHVKRDMLIIELLLIYSPPLSMFLLFLVWVYEGDWNGWNTPGGKFDCLHVV